MLLQCLNVLLFSIADVAYGISGVTSVVLMTVAGFDLFGSLCALFAGLAFALLAGALMSFRSGCGFDV